MKQMNKKTTLQTIRAYIAAAKKYRVLFWINVISPILGVLIGATAYRYYLAKLFELLAAFNVGEDSGPIINIMIITLTLAITEVVFWRINDYTVVRRHVKAARDLEQSVFARLIQHSYEFFANSFAGSIVTQFNRYTRGYLELERIFLFEMLTTSVNIIASAVVLLILSPPMGIAMLIWVVIFIISVVVITIKKSKLTRAEAAADSRVTGAIADAITNILNVKTFAHSDFEQSRFNEVSNERAEKRLRSWMRDAHIRSYRWFMVEVFIFTFVILSVYLVLQGQVSVGIVLAAQLYMMSIYHQLFSLNQTIERMERSLSESAEMTQLLEKDLDVVDVNNPQQMIVKEGRVTFSNVVFRYADAGDSVFDGLNLDIPAGQKVGLVGPSGGGKTTFTRVLLRFADIDKGQVQIDGQDITEVTQDDLRKNIAYVPQEPILFHRSLMDNIRYSRPDASDAEVYEVARLAHAAEFIDQLPKKYQTLVGERGVKLSGGEKQRVAIARAMLSKAPLLILDEATSALDSKSEKLITSALDNLMRNRTTVVIAHRLSTIKKLDRILVMQGGRVIEDGKHQQLLRKKGTYAELWSHQSGDFID